MDCFHVKADQKILDEISSLGLAHLGDAVYELMVRYWVCMQGRVTNKNLHEATITYVSAPAQARMVKKILSFLSEEELDIFHRGRNSHLSAIPKGASVGQYHASTGLEALFGWLYLNGEIDRLNELFSKMVEE